MTASRVDETIALIRQDEWRMACLHSVAALHLPDCYLAAGFLRNAIWDALHGKKSRTPLNDVAPFGLAENWVCRVTPNPQVSHPPVVYNMRIRQKRWQQLWPKLQIVWAEEL